MTNIFFHMYMLEVIIAVLVLLLLLIVMRKKSRCGCGPVAPFEIDPFLKERSLIELEAEPRSVARDGLPDLVGNMWNVEKSTPPMGERGLYMTGSETELVNPYWNRYSINKACSGNGTSYFAKVRSPTKDVVFS